MLVGLVGKTNVGKTTFFSAATLVEAERGNRPFVTIEPNEGVAYVRVESVCREFGVSCEPRTGWCNGRNRFAPVKVLDVAGLVSGAHRGRGLGNKFLDDLRRAPVNILVVDASGGTDSEGNPVPPGTHDPTEDYTIVSEEMSHWIAGIIKRNVGKASRRIRSGEKATAVLADVLSGLGVRKEDVERSAELEGLDVRRVGEWGEDDLLNFARRLREISKPFVVAANKVDVPEAERFLEGLRSLGEPVIPTSAESELILRRAAAAGLIRYEPGDPSFEIVDESRLTEAQRRALKLVEERVLDRFGSTGVQEALETAVFDVAGFVAVFPVENENRLSDRDGRVLPDVFLMKRGSTVRDLAYRIHSEIGERAVGGLDVRTKRKIPLDRELRHRDVVKILARRG